jgi:thiol-disulfide isomerase/thioredoxin
MREMFLVFMLLFRYYGMCQTTTFEVFGRISGDYKSNIYFFIDNDISHKDSLKAEIRDGRFYFKEKAKLPILCKFHFGEKTNLQEVYIDKGKTYIELKSRLDSGRSSANVGDPRTNFTITKVSGSESQREIDQFNFWKDKLDSSNLSKEEKHNLYFQKLKDIIEASRKSKVGAYLIVGGGYLVGRGFLYSQECPLSFGEVNELRDMLDSSLHNSYEWANIARLLNVIDKGKNLATGEKFPSVFLYKKNKDSINIEKMVENKVVLIDFWASWCGPCRSFNKELIPLYAKYKAKGFEIVSISLDENYENWKTAMREDRCKWIQLLDKKAFNGELAKRYDIRSIPFKILLDKSGRILSSPSSVEDLKKQLNGLFHE